MGRFGQWNSLEARRELRRDAIAYKENFFFVEDLADHLYKSYQAKYGFIRPWLFTQRLEQVLRGDSMLQRRRTRIPEVHGQQALDDTEELSSLMNSDNTGKKKADYTPLFRMLEGNKKKREIKLSDFDDDDIVDLVDMALDKLIRLTTTHEPMEGVILYGPGKLADDIFNEATRKRVSFYRISGTSEVNIRELFSKAYQMSPSIVFIDEIDSIEPHIVTQLMACMDEYSYVKPDDDAKGTSVPSTEAKSQGSHGRPGHVLVLGTTTRPDAIPPAVKTPNRFSRVIGLVEKESSEEESSEEESSEEESSEEELSEAELSVDLDNNGKKEIVDDDMMLKAAVSSGEGDYKPPVLFKDLAMDASAFKAEEQLSDSMNIDDDVALKDSGVDAAASKPEVIVPFYLTSHRPMSSGILLHGPPGCGKTKLAHAIANETGLPFYHISGASEESIRELFSKAYQQSLCIVLIDEIDAIERRVVTQLMMCMDEPQGPGYVLVIGATNRPDAIDPELRRPGRFDREIALGMPDENARVLILSILTRRMEKLSIMADFEVVNGEAGGSGGAPHL